MLKIQHEKGTLELYASPKEMSITRRQALQKWILHDSGIGNDMYAVDQRLAKLLAFSSAGKVEEVHNEAINLRYTFFSMLQGIDYTTRSFACFVGRINGDERNDISDQGLKDTAEAIGAIGFTSEEVDEWFKDVKKNLMPN